MDSNRYVRLAAKAAGQHGVFSRADAREIGIPDSTLANGVASGRYRHAAPGTFVIAGSAPSMLQRMAVAVLSLPSFAALSHETAAEMWGLTSRGHRGRIDVVTTRWDRVDREGATVHESRDLVDVDVTRLDGLPVTTPARTVVDLGASNRWIVESALEAGIRHGLCSLADVEVVVDRVGRKGRRGVGVVRPLIEARRKWDTATESALEDRFRSLMDELGLPRPCEQYVVRDDSEGFVCRADFAYPAQRLFIELDSEAHHLDRLTFRRDRAKQNSAVVLGWTVLRYTWWDLKDDPYRVGDEVRAALARDLRSVPSRFRR